MAWYTYGEWMSLNDASVEQSEDEVRSGDGVRKQSFDGHCGSYWMRIWRWTGGNA